MPVLKKKPVAGSSERVEEMIGAGMISIEAAREMLQAAKSRSPLTVGAAVKALPSLQSDLGFDRRSVIREGLRLCDLASSRKLATVSAAQAGALDFLLGDVHSDLLAGSRWPWGSD